MALDKRKRKKVNAAVQQVAEQRKKIRRQRIDGERKTEAEDLVVLSELLDAKRKSLAESDGFTNRLETFDTGLIQSKALPQKVKGKWVLGADTNKDAKLSREIERLRQIGQTDQAKLIEKFQNGDTRALEKLALTGVFHAQLNMVKHWTEETLEMDEDTARDVLAELVMVNLQCFDASMGIAWEASLQYGENHFRAEHYGLGRATQYRFTKGDAAVMMEIKAALPVFSLKQKNHWIYWCPT